MIDFKALRCDKNHHLGLGNIRITLGQQEEIEQEIATLTKQLEESQAQVARLRDAVCIALNGHGDEAEQDKAAAILAETPQASLESVKKAEREKTKEKCVRIAKEFDDSASCMECTDTMKIVKALREMED